MHWIEITAYYAKFYLANSIITLVGVNLDMRVYIKDPN